MSAGNESLNSLLQVGPRRQNLLIGPELDACPLSRCWLQQVGQNLAVGSQHVMGEPQPVNKRNYEGYVN